MCIYIYIYNAAPFARRGGSDFTLKGLMSSRATTVSIS